MFGKLLRSVKTLWPLAGIATAAALGWTAPAFATSQSVTWTTQDDFERNASTTGSPTNRQNADTATTLGDLTIGSTKELVSGGVIAFGSVDKLYAIGAERRSVAVMSASTKTLLHTIELPGKASGIVFNSRNNKIYVGSYNDNKVTVIDGNTDTIINTVPVGNGAYAAAYNSVDNKVYIGNMSDNTLTIVDGADDHVIVPAVAVVAGPYNARFDATNDRLFITNKYNHSVSVIDGALDKVDTTISIERVVALVGGGDVGNVGLRVDARALGITAYDRVHLKWNYDTLPAGAKIQFQVRSADSLALLDSATYNGPQPGSADSWYENVDAEKQTEADGTETASVDLKLSNMDAVELQVKLSSDDTASPVLHSVTLEFESYPDLIVSAVSGPSTGLIGRPITVSSAVKNQGTEAAGAFTVGLYLTDVTTGASNSLNCDRAVASLAPGASDPPSSTATSTCIVPDIAEGTYYIEAVADPDNRVIEGVENNNRKLGNLIRISKPFPDLISGISGPATGTINGGVTVLTSATNSGNGAAGAFNLGAYLVDADYLADPTKGIKKFLCSRTITSLAEEGGTDSLSTLCTIPTMPTGDYFFYSIADDGNAVPEENENNNTATGNAISISCSQTDLVVKSVSGTVDRGVLTYTVKVKNQGSTAAGPNNTGIYFSADANITTSDYAVTSIYRSSIAPGAEAIFSGTVNVPVNMPAGNYYLGALADSTSVLSECDRANNALAGNQQYLYNDLEVTAVSGTALGNGQINYSVTVKNRGNGRVFAGALYTSTAGLYLSTDATITTSDYLVTAIGASGTIPVIAGGGEYTFTGNATLPLNLPAATYYVGAIANPAKDIPEPNPDPTGNALAGNQQYIFNDLAITAVSGTALGNGQINYSVTVKNRGNGRVFAGALYTSTAGLYLSTDPTVTTSDYFVASVGASGTIPVISGGGEYTFTGTTTLPLNLPDATYYVGAIANPSRDIPEPNPDPTDNSLAGNQQHIFNDLVITAVSGTALGNGQINYSVTVKNQGNGRVFAGALYTSTASLYLSTDATMTTGDSFVVSVGASGTIPVISGGGEYTFTGTTNLPVNLADANYYVGAIANAGGDIPESDKTNNALVGNQQHIFNDLKISAVSATVNASRQISYSITVANQGNGRVFAGALYTSTGGVYLSADTEIKTTDYLVTAVGSTGTIPVISGGNSYTFSSTTNVPSSVPAGTYYVGGIANATQSIPENDYTNNTLAGTQVTVP